MARKKVPIYFVVRRLVDPATGEPVGALVPHHELDKRAMKERGYTTGREVRAELSEPRNLTFFRLAHRVGAWLSDNTELFAGLSQHAAVKALQAKSGIGCIEASYDIEGLGKLVRMEPESLNFEDMPEDRWRELWNGWVEWIRLNAYPGASPEAVEAVEGMILGERELWRVNQ